MARPSLKQERTDQILDALERCLVKHGLDGATQDRIAEEAGLARPLLRHNVGNRDAMLRLGLDRFMARSDQELQSLFDQLPSEGRAQAMISWLFDPRYFDAHAIRVLDGFSSWALGNDAAGADIVRWTERFIDALLEQLRLAYPDSKPGDQRTVATAIAGLYFQLSSLTPLGGVDSLQEQTLSAGERLLTLLD